MFPLHFSITTFRKSICAIYSVYNTCIGRSDVTAKWNGEGMGTKIPGNFSGPQPVQSKGCSLSNRLCSTPLLQIFCCDIEFKWERFFSRWMHCQCEITGDKIVLCPLFILLIASADHCELAVPLGSGHCSWLYRRDLIVSVTLKVEIPWEIFLKQRVSFWVLLPFQDVWLGTLSVSMHFAGICLLSRW